MRLGTGRAPPGARTPPREQRPGPGNAHARNLFEATAAHVSAGVDDDRDRTDEAADRVSPEALPFGVNELACRAVIALARERDESPRDVVRALLGLPAA
ncbi:hypothetical protein ACIQWB_31235 [Streptomyces olivaceus]|uniref:hypothetical protein n=1 Tax=Streptomyces olivaceus TaxID=47716 RepID=UPI0037F188E9